MTGSTVSKKRSREIADSVSMFRLHGDVKSIKKVHARLRTMSTRVNRRIGRPSLTCYELYFSVFDPKVAEFRIDYDQIAGNWQSDVRRKLNKAIADSNVDVSAEHIRFIRVVTNGSNHAQGEAKAH